MAVIFNDTFTGAAGLLTAHAPDTGVSWTEVQTAGAVNARLTGGGKVNQGNSTGTSGVYYLANTSGAYPSPNYDVQMTFDAFLTGSNTMGLLARRVDANNMYYLNFNESKFQLFKRVGGTWTAISSDLGAVAADGAVIRMRVNGTSIKVYVNGSELISVTDSSISAAGQAGFGGGRVPVALDSYGNFTADSFSIDVLAAIVTLENDNLETSDTTPAIQFSADHATGDPLTYNIQIDTDPAFASPDIDDESDADAGFANIDTPADTNPFTSGESVTYTPQSALTRGTYHIRVRAKGNDGQYGEWAIGSIHIYQDGYQINKGSYNLLTLPTTNAHQHNDSEQDALTDSEYTAVEVADDSRVTKDPPVGFGAYWTIKAQADADVPFAFEFEGQVNSAPGDDYSEGFEGGALPTGWTTGGNGTGWAAQTLDKNSGTYALRSAFITDSQQTWLRFTSPITGTLSFYWRVSSESGFDFLTFKKNGVNVDQISGTPAGFAQKTNIPVVAGDILEWNYNKDSSESTNSDCGWLDDVFIENAANNGVKVDVFNVTTGLWENKLTKTDQVIDTDFSYSFSEEINYDDYFDGSGFVTVRVYTLYETNFSIDKLTLIAEGNVKKVEAKARIVKIAPTRLVSPPDLTTGVNSPATLVWIIPENSYGAPIHANVQIDNADTFESPEFDLYSYKDAGFEYWNGSAWVAYPTTGVLPQYAGNQARVTVAVTEGTKHWRARGGRG
ncbi:MAG TPA: hypothetical protein VEA58_11560 [Anaerovoracaceae bacterium]|nr:hypothetical protein [Anaerovoracaceae bacterium]